MDKGYIQVYTGNGKGKTTAAFGVAIRAAMCGKKVFIGQFVKGMAYSETAIAEQVEAIEIEQFGSTCFIDREPTEEDRAKAQRGLESILIKAQQVDVLILDELTIALHYNLIDISHVLDFLERKPVALEVIITGRYCPDLIIEKADLVTEMKEIKHYYQQGVLSRRGIDC